MLRYNLRMAQLMDEDELLEELYRERAEVSRLSRLCADQKVVIKDQRNHIKNLEAELRPNLVRPRLVIENDPPLF